MALETDWLDWVIPRSRTATASSWEFHPCPSFETASELARASVPEAILLRGWVSQPVGPRPRNLSCKEPVERHILLIFLWAATRLSHSQLDLPNDLHSDALAFLSELVVMAVTACFPD